MSPFGYTLDDDVQRERVVASTVISGSAVSGGEETVVEGLPWHSGELYPARLSTLHSAEIEPPRWFGSYELREPGR
jgi:hypothetical protein